MVVIDHGRVEIQKELQSDPRFSADPASALVELRAAPIAVNSVDDVLVDEALELKSTYPFAYADAFAAALAIRPCAPLVTGDAEFRRLESNGLLALRWVGA